MVQSRGRARRMAAYLRRGDENASARMELQIIDLVAVVVRVKLEQRSVRAGIRIAAMKYAECVEHPDGAIRSTKSQQLRVGAEAGSGARLRRAPSHPVRNEVARIAQVDA